MPVRLSCSKYRCRGASNPGSKHLRQWWQRMPRRCSSSPDIERPPRWALWAIPPPPFEPPRWT
jgi:hypothetical protein